MKKNQLILFLGLFLLLFSEPVFAQKKVLTDEEEVTEMVTKEMDELFKDKDFLKQKDKKFKDVKGTIVSDISVIQSGKVSTLFKVDSDINNPSFTNFLLDYIINYKFKFKLQKQQRYKIRYTVTF
ncbi:hypothetical protein C3L50_13300 [Flavobacterium alvei]|uniref:TonB C-terminal domain-containing protein n=1 Tax=Flavobacterium alvei TaxID=2080416 RepID=A0A2S5A814_9FLAO|nr:hypothetical protein [Flavobacterium alvei]POY38233.1 hypothetical protein C3L50_13300 [Flavobacterium alvei]